jgi:cellulose synthase/poly-beta-1,6-N-acetylglucosamine synthase-like glycosyltransferase
VASVPDRPAVTVILPVRNEAACIGRALAAVLGQDYPKDRLEILVVDGMSTDGPERLLKTWSAARLVLRPSSPVFRPPSPVLGPLSFVCWRTRTESPRAP